MDLGGASLGVAANAALGGATGGAMPGDTRVDLGTGTGATTPAGGGTAMIGAVASPGTGPASGMQVSPMTAAGSVWDGTVSTPAATPLPQLPGTTALSDADRRVLSQPETLPADPDAGTPRATVTTPTPTLPNAVVTTPTTLNLPDVWPMAQNTSRPYSAAQDAQDWARAQRLGYTRAEYDDLARDPDHAGQINDTSQWERGSLLEAEERGLLPGKQKRGPKGSDGEDGTGQYWDVKSFDSNYPPSKGGFTTARGVKTIEKELDTERALGKYDKVLVETRWMKPTDVQALEQELQARPSWVGKVEILK